jgi:hypothetical protein
VEMSTHLAYSGTTPSLPSRSPGISRNWRRTSSIISLAARPTAFIVMAANRNGSIAPMNSPTKTSTDEMSSEIVPPASTIACWNATNSASAVITAEPIAKPLATAAVVLPRLSSSSVTARTFGSRCAISAMPPALSAIGP